MCTGGTSDIETELSVPAKKGRLTSPLLMAPILSSGPYRHLPDPLHMLGRLTVRMFTL